jgi:hypothetical protein
MITTDYTYMYTSKYRHLTRVTIDGVSTGDRIYWSDIARDYTLQFTTTHTLVSTVTSSLAVAW